ncbi:MAG: zinc-ribbon domain-containing protein, partial [Promethearchaeota archaeon]
MRCNKINEIDYCINCGAEINPKESICNSCGAIINPKEIEMIKKIIESEKANHIWIAQSSHF